MIVRIATEGQYELTGSALQQLDELDNRVLDAVSNEDEKGFREAFEEVVGLIRGSGTKLPDASLKESDVILPPPDTTLKEAQKVFEDYPRHLLGEANV